MQKHAPFTDSFNMAPRSRTQSAARHSCLSIITKTFRSPRYCCPAACGRRWHPFTLLPERDIWSDRRAATHVRDPREPQLADRRERNALGQHAKLVAFDFVQQRVVDRSHDQARTLRTTICIGQDC